MKTKSLRLLILLSLLQCSYVYSQTIREEWKTMNASKKESLEAFNQAKFGMFIHWGLYAVPAGKWEGREIPGIGEWIMYRARIPRDKYKALSKDFNPEDFDADVWVKLAKDAGMKYIVAMPKHHDGFAMYQSRVSSYNIYKATPFKRDPIDELYNACMKHGISFGFYYSHATDWMDGGDARAKEFLGEIENGTRDSSEFKLRGGRKLWPANDWDPAEVDFEEYLQTKAMPQVEELLQRYPNTKEIWFDVPMYMTEEQSFRFYKLVYELNPDIIINSRVGNYFGDFWIPGDNKIPDNDDPDAKSYWETPGTMNNTWGYKSYDKNWKSAEELIYWITEIASKGGNYLLNVGPDAKGVFPEESVEILKEIGIWMKVNGEAIYGTSSWIVSKEGPNNYAMKGTRERAKMEGTLKFSNEDFWFTQKDNFLYAISLSDTKHGKSIIKSINPKELKIKKVELLGSDKKLKWKKGSEFLEIDLPRKNTSNHGYVLKISH